ncbi:MAG: CvpA family protein [Chitinophagaceae bacterium]|uniref:CvpA family protein n=1 Tax=unclassified Paraflavitalea TaxID=2798305 RepID=UPI003D351E1F|nr:CvpA family protein [Chitinophagaceae bacterium]
MSIDLLYMIVVAIAIIKGLKKGLIVALFSFFAIFIGLAAATKLSVVVAAHFRGDDKEVSVWLPMLSFVGVLVAVVLVVRLIAKFIETSMELAFVGWVNKLGGAILYTVLYTTIFSILLFYLVKGKIIQPSTVQESVVYPVIGDWGPGLLNGLGAVIPWFKNMFQQLEYFFGNVAEKIQEN